MTVRPVRGASLGVAGALVAGLVIAPMGMTAATAAGSDGPSFYPISTDAVSSAAGSGSAERSAVTRSVQHRTASKVAVAKKTQILQTWDGVAGPGNNGVSVATGPKHVVEATAGVIRAYTKATGAVPPKGNKPASTFFGLGAGFTVTQPTVAYDPVGKRFIAVAITDESGDVGLAMRISKGTAAAPLTNKKWQSTVVFGSAAAGDPPASDDTDEWNPKIGVSADKLVVTTVADDPTDATTANRIFFFPKGAYYAGNEPGAWAADLNTTYNGQAPAVNATKQNNAFVAIPATNDVTVTTYTGAATNNPPGFSKNVVYPSGANNAPPIVSQGGVNDDLDLGGLEFTGVAWRSNKLYAATTVNAGGRAGVRVFGISTGAGVSLNSTKTLSNSNVDWFDPDLAIDGAGNVLLTAQDVGTSGGPSLAVFARKASTGKWVKGVRFIARGANPVNQAGNPIDWWNSTGAAVDPTSPWDVWVAGSAGDDPTSVARVSLAKNKATIKASDTKVNKGSKVKFTVKLARPDSKDTIKGLPVALQKSPKSGNNWSTVKSAKTSAKGTAQWKLKIKKAAKFRTLGKQVKQQGGAGRAVDKVTSKAVTVNLK